MAISARIPAPGWEGVLRAASLLTAAMVLVGPSSGQALQIDLSNPFYRVWSIVGESIDGEFVSDRFDDNEQNATGVPMSVFVDRTYAAAAADFVDPLDFSASSSVSGFAVLESGLTYATAEGGFWFETDLLVSGDAEQAVIEVRYLVSKSFISTDPKFHRLHDPNGTGARSSTGLVIYSGSEAVEAVVLDPGEHVLSAVIDVGSTHRLSARMNGASTADGTAGSASASVTLRILSVSAQPIPEPATGLLLGPALLAALVISRPRRRA